MAARVVSDNLSVRELENISNSTEVKKKVPIVRRERNNNYSYVESELREILGTINL